MCYFDETYYEDEMKIQKSGVRNIFTPHTPIDQESLFKGRRTEVQQILSTLNTPGQHVLLFGDRGVGKSSLANISSKNLVEITGKKLIIKRCSKTDTFPSIFESVFEKIGINPYVSSRNKSYGVDKYGIAYKNEESEKGINAKLISPSWITEQLKDSNLLILIDEFDAIQEKEDKRKIAELIKLLSDYNSVCKLFIVGIAESADELTAGHPSVQRCLKEIKLSKMDMRELHGIILNGSERLKINFTRDAKFRICLLSSGYPHFTHLIALKASEEAIVKELNMIDIEDVNSAIEKSISDCENSLRLSYDETVQSAKSLAIYRKILYATSFCYEEFIRSSDIRSIFSLLFEEELSQARLNNYLSKIVSSSNDKLLRRLAKGVYRFNDPRMSAYIRLVQSDMYSDKEDGLYSKMRTDII